MANLLLRILKILDTHCQGNLEKVHQAIHMDQWHTMNNVIRHLRQDVGRKHTLVLLQHHDNKPANTALSVTQFLTEHKWHRYPAP